MASEMESKPLLQNEEKFFVGEKEPASKHAEESNATAVCGVPAGPVGEGIVMGEPVDQHRQTWSTGLFSCLGSNDEFCGSDLEVCVLGCLAPCVLYGSNVERLRPGHCTFGSHCMRYSTIYVMGHFLFNGNFLAPYTSFPSRTLLRRQHNIEGCGEDLLNSPFCCHGRYKFRSEEKREQFESVCDFAAHFCCHQCALCQEGREIRRRTLHPAHRSVNYSMAAPTGQFMQ